MLAEDSKLTPKTGLGLKASLYLEALYTILHTAATLQAMASLQAKPGYRTSQPSRQASSAYVLTQHPSSLDLGASPVHAIETKLAPGCGR